MATKMAVIDNMHIHVRVFEVTEFNSEVRSDLRGYIIISRSSLGPLPSCCSSSAHFFNVEQERTLNVGGKRRGDTRGNEPLFTVNQCFVMSDTTYVQTCAEKRDCFAKHQPGVAGCGWLQLGRNFLST